MIGFEAVSRIEKHYCALGFAIAAIVTSGTRIARFLKSMVLDFRARTGLTWCQSRSVSPPRYQILDCLNGDLNI